MVRQVWLPLALSLSLLGCQWFRPNAVSGPAAGAAARASTRGTLKAPTASALIGMDGATLIGMDGATLIGMDGATLIGMDGATLKGELRAPAGLIGMDGATLIGMDGATLIGQDGATLIGLDGATLQSARSQALSKAALPRSGGGPRFALTALKEGVKAGIAVYLRTADGKFITGKDGTLLVARTDAAGRFAFPGLRAPKGVIFFAAIGRAEGQIKGLRAVYPKDQDPAKPVRLDSASTLTTCWIEHRVLPEQRDAVESLGRLSAAVAESARQHAVRVLAEDTAKQLEARLPSELAETLDTVAKQAGNLVLAQALAEVRRVMTLAGLSACRADEAAAEVALPLPVGLAAAPDGSVFVSGQFSGYLLRLDPVGRVQHVAGPCRPESKVNVPFERLAVSSDGWLYLGSRAGQGVWRCRYDGTEFTRVVGTDDLTDPLAKLAAGSLAQKQPVKLAKGLSAKRLEDTEVTALAPGKDGTLWMAVKYSLDDLPPVRVLQLDASGTVRDFTPDPVGATADNKGNLREIVGLAEARDGALWAWFGNGDGSRLYRRPVGGAWRALNSDLRCDPYLSTMVPYGADQVLLSVSGDHEGARHGLELVDAEGKLTPFAGEGPAGFQSELVDKARARFSRPAGLAVTADGTVLVADHDNATLRAIAPSGQVRPVLGSRVAPGVLAREAPLAMPLGLTLDPKGRPVVVEAGSHAVRRLEEGALALIAGGEAGFTGHARARGTMLENPVDIAAAGEDFYLVEQRPRRLRKLYANGEVETMAGGGKQTKWTGAPGQPARDFQFEEMLGLAVTKAGLPVFGGRLQNANGTWFDALWRVEADGSLVRLAGTDRLEMAELERDTTLPALDVPLERIMAVAVAPDGGIAFAEFPDLRVEGVSTGSEPNTRILRLSPDGKLSVLAGGPLKRIALKFLSGELAREVDVPAHETGLLTPRGLAYDAEGRLYIGEVGTRGMEGFADFLGVSAGLVYQFGIEWPDLWGRIRRLESNGHLVTLAGLGLPDSGTSVRSPAALAIAPDGRIVFLDMATSQLKELAPPK
ncbi:MAG: hypothetical protein VKP62_02170 [Candidatus Sericytochromatia bacterium]|nr:hypothetical protein [Candidatus Sericytochromatia bacterium]